MIYGYARVSSPTQDMDTQVVQLTAYRCHKIFQEKLSGRSLQNRTQFTALLDLVTTGDTIVVPNLDRFTRSTQNALNTMTTLTERGVALVVLNMAGMWSTRPPRLASSSSRCWPGLPNSRPI